MSVAKPILEYVDTISTKGDLSRSVRAFRRLLKYHKPYIHIFALMTAISALRAYLFTLEPFYTTLIFNNVIGPPSNPGPLSGYVLMIVLAVISFGLTDLLVKYLGGYVAQLILRDIRNDYYASIQRKSFGFFDANAVGDLLSGATMDLQPPVDMFLRSWVDWLTNAVFITVFVLHAMYMLNPIMTIMALAPVLLVLYLNYKLFSTIMPLFRKMQLIIAKLGAYMQQNIVGMKNVRIFGREKEMEEGFEKVEDIQVSLAILTGKIASEYMPSTQTILTLGIAMIYVYGANLVVTSLVPDFAVMMVGTILLFARYIMRLTMPITQASQLPAMMTNAAAGLERVYGFIDSSEDVEDRPDSKEVLITEGKVEFRDVTFGYAREKPVLNNISFTANPGEKIAILGATGSGKSSLLYLIPRFYDVDSGSILIDGVDVRSFKLPFLRRQIGLVLQDVFLFSGTIKSNIAFGRPDASMDEIKQAAKMARIDDFIESLPEKYDTAVGERGVTLSGGQKQRLTIARALSVNPRIVMFDDSLSFVDARTEEAIQQAIDEAMKGRTCFIIAQRLSTIKHADKIMVLDNGEIVEFGTHEELMAKGNIYQRIYMTQFVEKSPEDILAGGAVK
jgi:ABC-type multidrug transport system fused ATPase/permease subunit